MAVSGTWVVREVEAGIDDDTAAGLMVEYLEWAHGRLREEFGVDNPPTDPGHAVRSFGQFRRPRGLFLLAECAGQPAGIGAMRLLSDDVAEVKRMYVVPGCRGRHISSAILDRLIGAAGDAGATTLRLDTCRFMSDAQRLYRSRGFVERPPYEGTEVPPRLQQHWVFFERSLDERSLAARPNG